MFINLYKNWFVKVIIAAYVIWYVKFNYLDSQKCEIRNFPVTQHWGMKQPLLRMTYLPQENMGVGVLNMVQIQLSFTKWFTPSTTETRLCWGRLVTLSKSLFIYEGLRLVKEIKKIASHLLCTAIWSCCCKVPQTWKRNFILAASWVGKCELIESDYSIPVKFVQISSWAAVT